MDAASLADLQVALKGFLQKGETIKLETKVGFRPQTVNWWRPWRCSGFRFLIFPSHPQTDSAILGGMIVSIGDKYVDMSTKTKIAKLTKIIRET